MECVLCEKSLDTLEPSQIVVFPVLNAGVCQDCTETKEYRQLCSSLALLRIAKQFL